MNKKDLKSLIVFLCICFAVEILAGFWTNQTVSTWYPTLNKPSWNPPSWVFGPAWTILYTLIAIAGWLIYKSESSRERTVALTLFGIQLFLNFIWSYLFFSLRNPLLGLIDILLLLLFVVLTIFAAWKVRRLAGLLLIPYLLWLLYATSLNLSIWLLNP